MILGLGRATGPPGCADARPGDFPLRSDLEVSATSEDVLL